MTEQQIRDRLAEVDACRAALSSQLQDALRRKRIKCENCGRRTVVAALTYIQTHFYISPYGCTGGDRWKEGEGQFVCPKCGDNNRLYDRPDVVALKRYFGSVEEAYQR